MNLKKELDGMLTEGVVIRIDFPKLAIEKFAAAILMLTNRKSSRMDGLIDFRTYTDSNIIDLYFSLEDQTKEDVVEFAEFVCKCNTLGEKYEISILDTIKIVPITSWLLEENKIIDEDEDFYVIKR